MPSEPASASEKPAELSPGGLVLRQVRYLTVTPKKDAVIRTIELVKGTDRSAPIVVAVTVETP